MKHLNLAVLSMTIGLAVTACSTNADKPHRDGHPRGSAATSAAPLPEAAGPAAGGGAAGAPGGAAGAPPPAGGPAAGAARGATGSGGEPPPATAGPAAARPLDPLPPPTDAACAPAVILPVVKRLVDDPATGLTVDHVEIPVCRNGYARVFTVPVRTPQRFQGDQLFLRLVDGAWTLVGRNASVDCGDAGLPPGIAQACAALG